jgi:hypothetical protein|nr:MAG TPA: hypothetical protein [Caudoviricetes sp.]
MKIKVKGIGQNIDKRTIKKILKDENTLVICKDFLTDDYLTDLQENFKNAKIENNETIIDDLHYLTCWTNDMKTIELFNSCCNYVLSNKNLEIILN